MEILDTKRVWHSASKEHRLMNELWIQMEFYGIKLRMNIFR